MSKILYKNENGEFVELPFLKGDKGDTGENGNDGKSAYQIALDNGFVGSQSEWLAGLKGDKGDKGESGASASITANEILSMLINVDGEGSGLDADLLDGHNSDYFATVNHNHNVATQSADGFLSSADKKKLDGISEGANNYIHPDTHPASMIEGDTSHRFVSDAEKDAWNNKVDKVNGKGLSTNDYTNDEKTKLAGISNYTLPIASADTLGGVKIGANLSINDGTLSADAQAINVTPLITENSTEAVSSGAVFSRIGNLKFVVRTTPPTSADNNTFTIVAPN